MPVPPAIRSLQDARDLTAALPGPDTEAARAAAEREPRLTKPPGALGWLEELAQWMAAWQGRHPPRMEAPRVLVFAGNHGITARGVSAYPPEVTAQMVANFEAGGAAINQLCRVAGAELRVQALDLDRPTADFTQAPAMSEAECAAAMDAGFQAAQADADVVCLGEMGIGNTTAAAAVAHACFGGSAADWIGPGTGVTGDAILRKVAVVEAGVARHRAAMTDGFEVLRHVGGRELAAIAGAVLGARVAGTPVLLDGYVSTAAAAILEAVRPGALDHCRAAHVSTEPGHRRLLDRIGQAPLLDLHMRLGEATGAALAIGLLKAAAACHAGMATFEEAGVSDKD